MDATAESQKKVSMTKESKDTIDHCSYIGNLSSCEILKSLQGKKLG